MPTETEDVRTAAIWCRVSTEDQAETSLPTQEALVREKLVGLGYEINEDYVYWVKWSSKTLENCQKYKDLNKILANKEVDALGFVDRDRLILGEWGNERGNFIVFCQKLGIELITCEETPIVKGRLGMFMEGAFTMSKGVQVDRANTGAKDGLRKKAERGLRPNGKVSYGYKSENANLLVPDANYPTAKLIWELALSGMTLGKIARTLTDRGIATAKRAPAWSRVTVHYILHNPIYAGRVYVLRYEVVEPKERRSAKSASRVKTSARLLPQEEWLPAYNVKVQEPIVTWQQFLEVQETLTENKIRASRNTNHWYFLRSLITCGECGGLFRALTRRKSVYVCKHKLSSVYRPKCNSKSVPCEVLDNYVISALTDFFNSSDAYLQMFFEYGKKNQAIAENIDGELATLRKEREANVALEGRAFDQMSPELFLQRKVPLMKRREYLDGEIAKKEKERESVEGSGGLIEFTEEFAMGKITEYRSRLDNLTQQGWRDILTELKVRVIVNQAGYDVQLGLIALPTVLQTARS